MQEYIIIKRRNWKTISQTICSLAIGTISIILGGLLYSPIFVFYMTIYRDLFFAYFITNSIIWLWVFIDIGFKYKPIEEKILLWRGKK
jgi:hypothetical protein